MRVTRKHVGIAVAASLGAVVAVVASGIVPVRASSEHWAVTRWFLDFAMSRSVSTRGLGVDPPVLDDPALVLRGAGHYETGCAPCHGRPGRRPSEVILEATPHPPLLDDILGEWSPAELYEIVRHGVKFTAMPAWPVDGRDDEVWAVVAFLLVMPELDERGYLTLAYGDLAENGDDVNRAGAIFGDPEPIVGEGAGNTEVVVARSCGRCHGIQGKGRGWGAFPSLAGQRREYLSNSLRAYRSDERRSGVMHPIAADLSSARIIELAAYFESMGGPDDRLLTTEPDSAVLLLARPSSQGTEPAVRGGGPGSAPPPADRTAGLFPQTPEPPISVERGEAIAARGLPRLEVPSCVSCHGPGERPRNPAFPLLAGQYFDYLVGQLRLFREGRRGGTGYGGLMHAAVRELEDVELLDVAAYYAALRG